MLQRVLRYLDPKGRVRATVRRWWRPSPPNVARTRTAAGPQVTCVLHADGDLAQLADRCRAVLEQDWRPLEVLLVGPAHVLDSFPQLDGVVRVAAAPDATDDPALLSGALVLTATGPARPQLVSRLVAALADDATRDEARGTDGDLAADGAWCLRRNRLGTPRGVVPAWPVHAVAPEAPVTAGPAHGPFVLRFDARGAAAVDLPYRWRGVLARPDCHALATDAPTAERLALLTPRTTFSGDPDRDLAQLPALAEASARPARWRPWRSPAPRRIVLQADHFTEGGMEQVIIDLAEALATSGFAPRLLILGEEGTAAARARDRGLAVDRLPAGREAYLAYLDRHDPDLVNAHYSTYGADLCAARGVPFVQTIHNMYVWFGPESVAAYQAADPHTHAYVCVSNNVARYADLTMGLPPSRMVVIPNGCDRGFLAAPAHVAAAAALRTELALPAGARVLLNVASIQPPKGQHVLIDAFARIAAVQPQAHVVILGSAADPAYESQQQRRARQLGLADRVHWVGRRADVSAFHQLADALVQPSFFEGWSLAITEAVLAGLPVIATDVGGATEQLHDTDGIVLPAAADDLTAVHRDTLLPLLAAPCPRLTERLAEAMLAVLARGGRRSRLPAGWRGLLRDAAYAHCAEAFHWFAAGGTARAARRWLTAPTEGTAS